MTMLSAGIAFATAAVERGGVAVVPLSPFAERDPVRHLVRLCFGKKDETIDAGIEAMARTKELFASHRPKKLPISFGSRELIVAESSSAFLRSTESRSAG